MAKYLVIVESPAKVKTVKSSLEAIMKWQLQRTCPGFAEKSVGHRHRE